MKVVVVEVDGLRAEYLGPYGNDWVETPAFNRVAAHGFVFDHCLIGSSHRVLQNTAVWTGLHPTQIPFHRSVPLPPSDNSERSPGGSSPFGEANLAAIAQPPHMAAPLASRLNDLGWNTVLISPQRSFLEHPLASSFLEHRLIGGGKVRTEDPGRVSLLCYQGEPDLAPEGEPAEEWSNTRMAMVFSELCETISAISGPALVWCHVPDLHEYWDAPLTLRMRHHEEGDPDPWPGLNVPRIRFVGEVDPDWLFPFVSAYAAQVEVLDLCLAGLWSTLQELSGGEAWMLVITSPRGLPLGEHGWLGTWHAPLHGETLHVPLIFAFSDGLGESERSQALVYPHDLVATILEFALGKDSATSADAPPPPEKTWVSLGGESLLPIIGGTCDCVRDRLFTWDGHETLALRTPGWFAEIRLVDAAHRDETPSDTCERQGHFSRVTLDDSIFKDLNTLAEQAEMGNLLKLTSQVEEETLMDWEIEELRRRVRLFVKPDDRWEVNEVADRCPQVASEFLRIAAEFLQAFRGLGDVSQQSPRLILSALPEILMKGPEP